MKHKVLLMVLVLFVGINFVSTPVLAESSEGVIPPYDLEELFHQFFGTFVPNQPSEWTVENQTFVYQQGNENSIEQTQSGEGNQAYVYQMGNYNVSISSQTGTRNWAGIVQMGDNNMSTTNQVGTGNIAHVYQVGNANTSTIQQTGSHFALIAQKGNGNSATIVQNGW